ncbi:hypothetical protein [Microcoleus asticus]|uniref:hypothetical protein n=1 Tax=Microcoleus asticus TaxID=2815231 RepID=UPI001C12FE9A|nr:hypothetical protein [Microcoleus asticus]
MEWGFLVSIGWRSPFCDRAQQAATNFLLFSVDLVMAQVDRTMQILSGGYLNSIRAGKIRLGD